MPIEKETPQTTEDLIFDALEQGMIGEKLDAGFNRVNRATVAIIFEDGDTYHVSIIKAE